MQKAKEDKAKEEQKENEEKEKAERKQWEQAQRESEERSRRQKDPTLALTLTLIGSRRQNEQGEKCHAEYAEDSSDEGSSEDEGRRPGLDAGEFSLCL